jgi:hypothetical protein
MNAYKVSSVDVMGYVDESKYYFDFKEAEGDLLNRLGTVITGLAELAKPSDLEGRSPWQIQKVLPHKGHIMCRAVYSYWEEHRSMDDHYADIVQEEFIIEIIYIS